jgi:hypothetical protein
MAGMVSANPVEEDVGNDSLQVVAEEEASRFRFDIFIGILAPYSTIGSDFNGSAYERVGEYKVLLPVIDGAIGWGGSAGLRVRKPGELTVTIEATYYRATHDYTWNDTTGKATTVAAGLEACAIYPRFSLQPLLFIGGSLVEWRVENSALDDQSNWHDAEHVGVDLRVGGGLNYELNKYLWLSGKIGYRRYWLPSITISGPDYDFDVSRKANGFWLLFALYAGIQVN